MTHHAMDTRERFESHGGWTALLLVLAMIATAGSTIVAAQWTDGLHILVWIGCLAVMAGMLLGISRIPGFFAHVFTLCYGAFAVSLFLGLASTGFYDGDVGWFDRLNDMSWRIYDWANLALTGGTSRDPLMFVLLASILFWLLGYTAAWYTFRHEHMWRALLPTGVLVLLTVYYYPQGGPADLTIYLLAYLLLALLYIVRAHLSQREKEWRKAFVTFSSDIQFDMLRAGLVFAVVMLIFAWGAPSAAADTQLADRWAEMSGPVRELQRDWSRLFSALRSYGSAPADAYGMQLTLGGPIQLGDEPLFDVYAPRVPAGRIYWRGVVFDRYDGAGWQNTDTSRLKVDAGGTWQRMTDDGLRAVFTQTVAPLTPAATLIYGAQSVVSVSRSVEYVVGYTAEDAGLLDSMVQARVPIRPGDTYVVVSYITQADPDSLRSAGTRYPGQMLERYTALPATVTQRTRDLAAQITAGARTPYDKAAAIETYLRENITYSENVSAPPKGQDAVDYVLFVTKTGYCQYYASAMVVMLRSVGIPARFAAGYAQGEYMDDKGAYRVRSHDAHAWPEVYFPKFGWVEFEPTSSQSPILRPVPAPTDTANQGDSTPIDPDRRPSGGLDEPEDTESILDRPTQPGGGVLPASTQQPAWVNGAIGLAVALALIMAIGVGTWWTLERRGLRGLDLVSVAYVRLLRYGEWLGLHTRPSQTPYERAAVVVEAVPESRPYLTGITDLYVAERFGRAQPEPARAAGLWGGARPALLRGMARLKVRSLLSLPRGLRSPLLIWRSWRKRQRDARWRG